MYRQEEGKSSYGNDIHWSDSELCDPIKSGPDFRLYEMIYDPLVRYGENGEIKPALAESWDISKDGTTLYCI